MSEAQEVWAAAIDRAVDKTEHAAHGGWEVTHGVIVCAWDGEPIAEAPEMPS